MMKMYFLVEGASSEITAYPEWIKGFFLDPEMRVYSDFEHFNDFKNAKKGVYFLSGGGYPSIIRHIENSIRDLNGMPDVLYFFVIIDSEDRSEYEVEREFNSIVRRMDIRPSLNFHVVIQKKCFESILLSNRRAISKNSDNDKLIEYLRYYDVTQECPERMMNFSDDYNNAQFHFEYARTALQERRMRYTKSNAQPVANSEFFNQVLKRVDETQDMRVFSSFIRILREIAEKAKNSDSTDTPPDSSPSSA